MSETPMEAHGHKITWLNKTPDALFIQAVRDSAAKIETRRDKLVGAKKMKLLELISENDPNEITKGLDEIFGVKEGSGKSYADSPAAKYVKIEIDAAKTTGSNEEVAPGCRPDDPPSGNSSSSGSVASSDDEIDYDNDMGAPDPQGHTWGPTGFMQ